MVSISRSVVSYEKGSKSKRRYRNQKKKERKKERKKRTRNSNEDAEMLAQHWAKKQKQYETTREKHVQCTRRLIDYWLYLKQVYVVALFFKVIFFCCCRYLGPSRGLG